jgi:hypothetical protein
MAQVGAHPIAERQLELCIEIGKAAHPKGSMRLAFSGMLDVACDLPTSTTMTPAGNSTASKTSIMPKLPELADQPDAQSRYTTSKFRSPSPANARNAITISVEGATAHSSDATPNSAMQASNVRLQPKMLPMRSAGTMKGPKTSS